MRNRQRNHEGASVPSFYSNWEDIVLRKASTITEAEVNKAIDILQYGPSFVNSQPTTKEHKMANLNLDLNVASANSRPTESEQKREHFLQRLATLSYEKSTDLEHHFGLIDDDRPKSPKELVERIKDGKFKIQKNEDDDEDQDVYFHNLLCSFIWRDPSKKKDHEGYKAAKKKLDTAYEDAQDKIWHDPSSAMNVVHTFEKAQFH